MVHVHSAHRTTSSSLGPAIPFLQHPSNPTFTLSLPGPPAGALPFLLPPSLHTLNWPTPAPDILSSLCPSFALLFLPPLIQKFATKPPGKPTKTPHTPSTPHSRLLNNSLIHQRLI